VLSTGRRPACEVEPVWLRAEEKGRPFTHKRLSGAAEPDYTHLVK